MKILVQMFTDSWDKNGTHTSFMTSEGKVYAVTSHIDIDVSSDVIEFADKDAYIDWLHEQYWFDAQKAINF